MPNDKDNWEHRLDNMRCKTCMFYVPKHNGKLGRCRQTSPTMKGFPAVFPDDWCGAHKLDEEKILSTQIKRRGECKKCGNVIVLGKCSSPDCITNAI